MFLHLSCIHLLEVVFRMTTFVHCSVGSLGRYRNEGDVSGLVVKNCSLTGTANGIRIKTWPNSPGSSSATNMTFENITMNNVSNPIIIDQSYCPFGFCSFKVSQCSLYLIFLQKGNVRFSSREKNIVFSDINFIVVFGLANFLYLSLQAFVFHLV